MTSKTLSTIEVMVVDTPSITEVMDRAKMNYLAVLMEQEGGHIPSVALRLGCSDANVRKSIKHLEAKYGDDTRGEGEGGTAESS